MEGNLHDLGKNVVVMMFESVGFEVFDLGKDVRTEILVERAPELEADLIAVSSLMMTMRPYKRALMDELVRLGLRDRIKMLMKGGSVTREWAEKIGADGYGRDAVEGIAEAKRLLGVDD